MDNVTLPPTETSTLNYQAFLSFYDTYAHKLWGLILTAKLPVAKSEIILLNTLTKAWQQIDLSLLKEKYLLAQLLKIAYKEGLPIECLQTVLKAK